MRRRAATLLLGVALLAGPAQAHVGALGGSGRSAPLPTWLVVLTGGGIIGASFLFTSLLTDHDLIRDINERRLPLPALGTVRTAASQFLGGASVLVLAAVVVNGLAGPTEARRSLAILVVWAGWWAGYTMSVYLVGNSWPPLNPWRRLATLLPDRSRFALPEGTGSWPAIAALLALVGLEVVSPVASNPRLLAVVVLGYTVLTLAGSVAVGASTWFGRVDPVARVFRAYGSMAPVQRTDDGLDLVLPGTALVRDAPLRSGDAAFVVALLWATTYDGLVSTPAWGAVVRPLVGAGVPALLVYAVALVAGFALFLGVYRLAARSSRRTAGSYVTADYVERWFAPALLPIAAGYHLAHFLGYFLTLLPALATVLANPLAPPATVTVLVLPDWFGAVQLLFVVAGHMLAVWVGHALAFALFTGRLQPIRSQYPFILVMVFYTMTSMWIVTQPYAAPPFV